MSAYKLNEEYNDLGKLTNRYTRCTKTGKLHGAFEIYRRNGQKLCKCNYSHGLLDGLYEEWYDNDQLYITAKFKMGRLISGSLFNYDGLFLTSNVMLNHLAVHELELE